MNFNKHIALTTQLINHDYTILQLTQINALLDTYDRSHSVEKKCYSICSFTFGIKALFREKKFSDSWSKVFDSTIWVLLDDCNRQLFNLCPDYPTVQSSQELTTFISAVDDSIDALKIGFDQLIKIERSESVTLSPVSIGSLTTVLQPSFNRFLLDQVCYAMSSFINGDPLVSDEDATVKSLFRVIEIVGEVVKLVDDYPQHSLLMVLNPDSKSKTLLWGQIRNELQHDKKRALDIARYAPNFIQEIKTVVKALHNEVRSYLGSGHIQAVQTTHTDSIKRMYSLLKQQYDRQMRNEIKAMGHVFSTLPNTLFSILLKVDNQHTDPKTIYETYAKPYLKSDVSNETIEKIQGLIWRSNGCVRLTHHQLQPLLVDAPEIRKSDAVQKMKTLLGRVSGSSDRSISDLKQYELLADQFVFESDSDKKLFCKLYTFKRKSADPLQTISDVLQSRQDLQNDLTNRILDIVTDVKEARKGLEACLNRFQETWPDEERFFDPPSDNGINVHRKAYQAHIGTLKKIKLLDRSRLERLLDQNTVENILGGMSFTYTDPKIKVLLFSARKIEEQLKKDTQDAVKKKLIQDKARAMSAYDKGMASAETLIDINVNVLNRVVIECINKLDSLVSEFKIADTSSKKDLLKKIKDLITLFELKQGSSLGTFFQSFQDSLKTHLIVDYNTKFDELVLKANDTIGVQYIINQLLTNYRLDLTSLEPLYRRALRPDVRASFNNQPIPVWEDICRKAVGFKLSYGDFQQAQTYLNTLQFNTDEKLDAKERFDAFLNGKVPLSSSDPHEQIGVFNRFLNWFSKLFPTMGIKQADFMAYFKTAYNIQGVGDGKAVFLKDIADILIELGCTFNQWRSSKNQPIVRAFLRLSAELDIQDIGEKTNVIPVSRVGAAQKENWLSPRQFRNVGIIRKMMAHYPLIVSDHQFAYHFESLAFDTQKALVQNGRGVPRSPEAPLIPFAKRQPVTYTMIERVEASVLALFDSVGLSVEFKVLDPEMSELFFDNVLTPFGDFSIIARPNKGAFKTEDGYYYALSLLESKLSHLLNAMVVVMGEDDQRLVRCPDTIPATMADRLYQTAIPYGQWKFARWGYEKVQTEVWREVRFKDGKIVTHQDHMLYKAYAELFSGLGLFNPEGISVAVREFLELPFNDIMSKVQSFLERIYENKSVLYTWIQQVFLLFSPPGSISSSSLMSPPTVPEESNQLLRVYDSNGKNISEMPSSIIYQSDPDEWGVLFTSSTFFWGENEQEASERLEETYFQCDTDGTNGYQLQPCYRPYYKLENEDSEECKSGDEFNKSATVYFYRVDHFYRNDFDDGYFLDEGTIVEKPDLQLLSRYFSEVVQAQKAFILNQLSPENGLERRSFAGFNHVTYWEGSAESNSGDALQFVPEEEAILYKESIDLATALINKIRDLSNQYGKDVSKALCQQLCVEKDLSLWANDYYYNHIKRLKGPYMTMDPLMIQRYNEVIASDSSEWLLYPFVHSFQQFLKRVKEEGAPFSRTRMIGGGSRVFDADGFSPAFKCLVPELDSRNAMKQILGKYEEAVNKVSQAFYNSTSSAARHIVKDGRGYVTPVGTFNAIYLELQRPCALFKNKSIVELAMASVFESNRDLFSTLVTDIRSDILSSQGSGPDFYRAVYNGSENTYVSSYYHHINGQYRDQVRAQRQSNQSRIALDSTLQSTNNRFKNDWQERFQTSDIQFLDKSRLQRAQDIVQMLGFEQLLERESTDLVPSLARYFQLTQHRSATLVSHSFMRRHTSSLANFLSAKSVEQLILDMPLSQDYQKQIIQFFKDNPGDALVFKQYASFYPLNKMREGFVYELSRVLDELIRLRAHPMDTGSWYDAVQIERDQALQERGVMLVNKLTPVLEAVYRHQLLDDEVFINRYQWFLETKQDNFKSDVALSELIRGLDKAGAYSVYQLNEKLKHLGFSQELPICKSDDACQPISGNHNSGVLLLKQTRYRDAEKKFQNDYKNYLRLDKRDYQMEKRLLLLMMVANQYQKKRNIPSYIKRYRSLM